MIESPSRHAEDIQNAIQQSSSSIHQRSVTTSAELTQKIQELIHGNTILTYYLRMSWQRKLSFFDELIKRIKSLATMKLAISTLQSLLGKLTAYCKSTTATPMNYDKVLYDHDRMLDKDILEENIALDLEWFESIEDQEQVAYLIAFLSISGQALMWIFIANLQSELAHRLKTQVKKEEEKEEKKDSEGLQTHDLDDPKHQKCLQLEKIWVESMGKFRKKVYTEKEPQKKSKKTKKKGKDESLDWIQIMPIMIVKKIFNYLDKKSLTRAKKVNAYWKWAIGDLLKDRKVHKSLNKIDKKLRKASGGCFSPESDFSEVRERVGHTERRLRKLQTRGAILEQLRQTSLPADKTYALITDAFQTFSEIAPFVSDVTMYPRVERKNSPIWKKPKFIVKDLEIICEDTGDLSLSEDDTGIHTNFSSSVPTVGSDAF
ncbi:uncharacterized protein LOC123004327 [Tribolium madens]|uniref:uncharacterized protein LOC123004327 n=1 Tax=Tribolium madens TaxID=41895 RepID=UPI001CF72AB8|nr:uncharacterized protein LOC123004327 [Tribolium madens]